MIEITTYSLGGKIQLTAIIDEGLSTEHQVKWTHAEERVTRMEEELASLRQQLEDLRTEVYERWSTSSEPDYE